MLTVSIALRGGPFDGVNVTIDVANLEAMPASLLMTGGRYDLWRSDDDGLMRTTTGAVCYRWFAFADVP